MVDFYAGTDLEFFNRGNEKTRDRNGDRQPQSVIFRPCLYQTDQIERESVTQKGISLQRENFFIRMTDIN